MPGPQGARPGFKMTVMTKWGWWSVLPTAYETQLVPRVGRDPWLCHLLPSTTTCEKAFPTAQTPPCLSSASSGLSPTFQQDSPSAHPWGCAPHTDRAPQQHSDLTHTHTGAALHSPLLCAPSSRQFSEQLVHTVFKCSRGGHLYLMAGKRVCGKGDGKCKKPWGKNELGELKEFQQFEDAL